MTILTVLGDVMGVSAASSNHVVFKGIPYTEHAPIGSYRFQESVVRTSAYTNDYLDATLDAPECIQYASGEQSEDCLFLNVFVPKDGVEMTANGTVIGSLPVMMWIHGGAFISGSADIDGSPFLRKSNVIYVAIQYRLAALGFLALDSIYNESNGKTTGGMNGVNDQIVALQWIQNYITDFGGDPDQVTIFGESAGGHSVCFLTLMPRASGLFQQAIMQSGNCSPARGQQRSKEEGMQLSLDRLSGVGLADNLQALRAADASTFRYWTNIRPSVDDYLLMNTTHNMLLNGDYSLNVDKLVIGSNSLDSLYLYPFFVGFSSAPPPQTDEQFVRLLREYSISDTDIAAMQNTYYPLSDFVPSSYNNENYSAQTMRWTTINSDVCYKCPEIFYIDQLLTHSADILNEDDIYLYNFIAAQPPNYASHASDIAFLYYNVTSLDFAFFGLSETGNKPLSDFMIDAWINFASYGSPNSSLNAQQWIPFQVNRNALIIGDDGSNADGVYAINANDFDLSYYRNGVCSFWNYHIGYDVMAPLCLSAYTLQTTSSPTTVPTVEPTAEPTEKMLVSTTEIIDESSTTEMVDSSDRIAMHFHCFVSSFCFLFAMLY